MSEQHTQEQYAIVAVASSAGGIRGLQALLGGLDDDLPMPVLVVQHLDRHHRTFIAEVLTRRSALPVKLAEDREPPRRAPSTSRPPTTICSSPPTGSCP